MDQKRALSFPLRLCPSIRQQATEIANQEGISLNHFISLAVAEKLSRLEHDSWIRQNDAKAPSPTAIRANAPTAQIRRR
ncbi:HicB family protein [Terriglobus roseus DSM 18391]|uniref:HicB family protein n=1 Tax=Terriglobus roseus (strain DSM 18391 / NRRL B-41598 / KBS 63) TaxID=926566 RepID=I3ZLI9_TERRK|nr:toxin-antitoxin system HicB family antitoxin [Terriglobus roseus]AFL90107.1 HicB family protein [Terriglobus roseus DSM 18391]